MNRTDELFEALEKFKEIPYVKYIQDQILTYPGTLSFQNCILPTDKMPNYIMLIDDNSPMGRFNNAKYQAVNHKSVIIGINYYDIIEYLDSHKNFFPFYQCRLALDNEIPRWMPNHRYIKTGDKVFVTVNGECEVECINSNYEKYHITARDKDNKRVNFSVTGHISWDNKRARVFKCKEDAIEYGYYYELSLQGKNQ